VAELNITNIPAPRVPFVDERTGLMAREWYRFFLNLFVLTGSGNNPITLEELQLGPPSQPNLAELLIQINQNIAPQYEDQSGDFLATLDTAQLMSMMARFENAEAAIQGAYLQPVVQTGTIANYNLDNSPTAGGIVYGTGPALAVSAAGTLGQVLTSAGAGTPTWAAAATGTVSSVAQSFTGGLISVAGSPITTSGTLALTVAGTSGGVPYFTSGTTWATSAALAASALVVGGGAGAAPATITTGTGVTTALGVNTGTAGAFVVNGGALGTPSSGTVTNLTGTASININGTVGATTANTMRGTTIEGTDTTDATSTTAAAVKTAGGLAVAKKVFTGDNVVPAAAKGVNFTGNTPAAGMTSQLMNWYEEGTWTPVMSFTTNGDLAVTYSAQVGHYERVGSQVTARFRVIASAFTYTTATGTFQITGLPFVCNATTNFIGVGPVFISNVLMTAVSATATYSTARVSVGTSIINIIISGNNSAANTANQASMPSGNLVGFAGFVSYRV